MLQLIAYHRTPVHKYRDDISISFSANGSGCTARGYSTSTIWYAVLDDGEYHTTNTRCSAVAGVGASACLTHTLVVFQAPTTATCTTWLRRLASPSTRTLTPQTARSTKPPTATSTKHKCVLSQARRPAAAAPRFVRGSCLESVLFQHKSLSQR